MPSIMRIRARTVRPAQDDMSKRCVLPECVADIVFELTLWVFLLQLSTNRRDVVQ